MSQYQTPNQSGTNLTSRSYKEDLELLHAKIDRLSESLEEILTLLRPSSSFGSGRPSIDDGDLKL